MKKTYTKPLIKSVIIKSENIASVSNLLPESLQSEYKTLNITQHNIVNY